MLIIPLTGKISRKNPPVITIGIILINCLLFFIIQGSDSKYYNKANDFYFESDLARIETSRYLDYVGTIESQEMASQFQNQKDSDKVNMMLLYGEMQSDRVFMQKLLNEEIITPEDQIYTTWKGLRTQIEELLSRTVTMRYGFKPAQKSLLTAFTYMFLHGGFMHLLGNMIFLWLVGCVLELGWGRLLYVMSYLIGGLLSVTLYFLVYMDSTAPLIGASGAIAGLIGAYAVTYGRRKIKVFYSLGFYFNYAQVTAIILLPIWIGTEFFQLFFGVDTYIAYVAHIGGLISGAALGYLNLKFLGHIDEKVLEQDPREKIPSLLEQALLRMGELDMNGARSLLNQVLEIEPHNRSALPHLFNIDKLNPENERFHKTASKILLQLSNDKEAHEVMYNTYKEYCRIAKHLKLGLDLWFRMSSYFAATGYLEESEKIMSLFLRKCPTFQKVPAGIFNLAQAYLKNGMSEKGRKYLRVLCQRYPKSMESQYAQQILRAQNSG